MNLATLPSPSSLPTAPRPSDWMNSNLDVYCYMKANLPYPYRIVAEPSAAYFSEWHYCYRIYCHDTEVACWQGDYRRLQPQELCQIARDFCQHVGVSPVW